MRDNHYQHIKRFYSLIAKLYANFLKISKSFQREIKSALPYIKGKNVLEIGIGTGYLASIYTQKYTGVGIDISTNMLKIAKQNIKSHTFFLIKANAEYLPFPNSLFDTVIATYVFSSIKNIEKVLREIKRVLKNRGRVVIVDVCFPSDGNIKGIMLVRFWKLLGDIIRDIPIYLNKEEFRIIFKKEFAKSKTVHIIVAEKV